MVQKVKMPDGVVVGFPDDMPKEEIGALIEHKFPEQVAAQKKAAFGQSHVGQGLSGLNEGLANIAGAPVDLLNTAMSAGPALVNTVFGTHLQAPHVDELGVPGFRSSDAWKATLSQAGATAPPTTDPLKQGIRRIGEEVGANIIPGMGAVGKAAKPVKTALTLAASTIGSGTGAAIAEQVAPGNQWAELAAQFVGGISPMLLERGGAKRAALKAAPTAEQLQVEKQAAYKAADDLGVKYAPKFYEGLAANIETAAAKDHLNPGIHPKSSAFIDSLAGRGTDGLTLTELDQLRQEARRDLIKSADEGEQHFGRIVVDQIDAAIAKAGTGDLVAGAAPDANKAILAARELNTRWRKTELIQDALYSADLKAAATGSGGNIANTVRQAFKAILLSDTQRAAFSKAEIALMEKVVKGDFTDNMLRRIGKMSPGGNGLMTALGIGGAATGNPLLVGAPIAGAIAKPISDARTIGKANSLRAAVASGNQNALRPSLTPDQYNSMSALTAAQIANDNAPANNIRQLRLKGLN